MWETAWGGGDGGVVWEGDGMVRERDGMVGEMVWGMVWVFGCVHACGS